MNAVKISELRQNLQAFVARARDGERIGVSVHGQVVAELVPVPDRQTDAERQLAELRKTAIIGDIITPIEYDWANWIDNILPADVATRKPRGRKR